MFLRRVVTLASVFVAVAACGPTEEVPALEGATAEYQRQRTDIVGGTVANGDPAVVALAFAAGRGEYAEFCTGTLIGSRTVLTAAHCYYPYGSQYDYYVVFGTQVAQPSFVVPISGFTRHPQYSPSETENDIAVIRLATAVTAVSPVGINLELLDKSWMGKPIRHVGFGNTSVTNGNATGSGTKRQVTYNIRKIQELVIESGTSGKQTCTGDSGGPGFITHPGSPAEVVAGVVSFGDQSCRVEGYDVNVATYADWVLTTMATWDTPSCIEDNRCKDGCAPVDPDCVCIEDNVCNPQCYNLDKDPDCPKNCAADGICAEGICPTPDEDCVEEGQTCQREEQCLWRACVSNPQHLETYCSMPCSSDPECAVDGMECANGFCRYAQRPVANIDEACTPDTLCTEGVCAGPTLQELRCRPSCTGPGTCPGTTQTCVEGATGALFCALPHELTSSSGRNVNPNVALPIGTQSGSTTATGCSVSASTNGAWWLALMALGGLVLRGRRVRRAVAASAVGGVVALGGCGPTEQQAPGASELTTGTRAIVGGTVNSGDPEVFMLMSMFDNGQGSGCTATLIGKSTLVTAAHCVDPRIGEANSVRIWAVNRTNAIDAPQSEWIELVETRMHPGWNPNRGDLGNDIAMAKLERSPGITPKPWNTSSVDGLRRQPLRAVGYGITSNQNQGSSGIKRHVNLVFDQIDSTHIYLGDGSGKGVCHGDSGGPSFHTFSDGVERIVGVHSYDASGDCVYGGDIRVDAYQSFVQQWLDTWEEPTCAEDGRCKATGCATVDVDCYCVADGACTADCKDLASDPDCPAHCAPDGVCSEDTCPVPDEDCAAEGEACMSEEQCQSRLCMSDPQHPEFFYCSRQCATSAQCPAGMECVPGAQVCQFVQVPEAGVGEACTPGETPLRPGDRVYRSDQRDRALRSALPDRDRVPRPEHLRDRVRRDHEVLPGARGRAGGAADREQRRREAAELRCSGGIAGNGAGDGAGRRAGPAEAALTAGRQLAVGCAGAWCARIPATCQIAMPAC